QLDVSVPGGRQGWPDRGVLPEPPARCRSGQSISTQSHEPTADSDEDHPRRLCRLPPCGSRSAGERRVAAARAGESSKYLNNLIEQDHRRVKHRLGPMLGFKGFRTAGVVISGGGLAGEGEAGE